jgi:acyl carrier protein
MALARADLVAYLAEKGRIDPARFEDDTPLFSSGLIDSFTMVDMLVFLEQHTGVKMAPEDIDLQNLDSVARILRFAAAKQGG